MSNYPTEVQNLLDKFENTEKSYNDCQILQNQLEGIGWTCDWGLDAIPENVRKVRTFGENHTVKCCNCGFSGFEEDLEQIVNIAGDFELNACPNCQTDNYLMDI